MATNRNSRRDFIKDLGCRCGRGSQSPREASSYAKIIGANDRGQGRVRRPGDRSRRCVDPSFLRLAGQLNFEALFASAISGTSARRRRRFHRSTSR